MITIITLVTAFMLLAGACYSGAHLDPWPKRIAISIGLNLFSVAFVLTFVCLAEYAP